MSLTPGELPPTVIVNNVTQPAGEMPASVHEALVEQLADADRSARYAREQQERWQSEANTLREQAERAEARAAELRDYLAQHTQPEPAGHGGPSGINFVQ